MFEALRAIITADGDDFRRTLRRIANRTDDAADSFNDSADAAEAFGDETDAASDAVSDADDNISQTSETVRDFGSDAEAAAESATNFGDAVENATEGDFDFDPDDFEPEFESDDTRIPSNEERAARRAAEGRDSFDEDPFGFLEDARSASEAVDDTAESVNNLNREVGEFSDTYERDAFELSDLSDVEDNLSTIKDSFSAVKNAMEGVERNPFRDIGDDAEDTFSVIEQAMEGVEENPFRDIGDDAEDTFSVIEQAMEGVEENPFRDIGDDAEDSFSVVEQAMEGVEENPFRDIGDDAEDSFSVVEQAMEGVEENPFRDIANDADAASDAVSDTASDAEDLSEMISDVDAGSVGDLIDDDVDAVSVSLSDIGDDVDDDVIPDGFELNPFGDIDEREVPERFSELADKATEIAEAADDGESELAKYVAGIIASADATEEFGRETSDASDELQAFLELYDDADTDERVTIDSEGISDATEELQEYSDAVDDAVDDAAIDAATDERVTIDSEGISDATEELQEYSDAVRLADAADDVAIDAAADERQTTGRGTKQAAMAAERLVGTRVAQQQRLADAIAATTEQTVEYGRSTDDASDKLRGLKSGFSGLKRRIMSSAGATGTLSGVLGFLASSSTVATAKSSVLAAAQTTQTGTAISAAVANGTLKASLLGLAVAVGVVLSLVSALAAALAGLAVVFGAAGGGLIALFGAGLLPIARDFKQASEDIESIWGGFAKIFQRAAKAARSAVAPLTGIEGFGDLAIATLNKAIDGLSKISQTVADLAPTLRDLFGAFFKIDILTPILNDLKRGIRELQPLIDDIIRGSLRALAGAVDVVTGAAVKVGPELAGIAEALAGLGPELVEIGVLLIDIFGPAVEAGIRLLDLTLAAIVGVLKVIKPFADVINVIINGVVELLKMIQQFFGMAGRETEQFLGGIEELDRAMTVLDNAAGADNSVMGGPPADDSERLPAPAQPAGPKRGQDPSDNNQEVNLTVNSNNSSPQETGRLVEKAVERALRRQRQQQQGTD